MGFDLIETAKAAVPVVPVTTESLKGWLEGQDKARRAWVAANGFDGKPGSRLLLPDAGGALERVLYGFDPAAGRFGFAALPEGLPNGDYRIDLRLDQATADAIALGWGLAAYRFERYRKAPRRKVRLVWPKAADRAAVERALGAIHLVRDLVNTPAEDMGPGDLAACVAALAEAEGGRLKVIEGGQLLKRNFPLIHAVGRAAERAPRLLDLTWGKAGPLVVLVGKGVCFDSGGLDLKGAAGMLLMKKDMGGAAHAIALAQMVMQAKLPLRLRLLVPAVENAVAGNAFRPLDVIRSRKGLTVEIGNTDAEGRLILADALALAGEAEPDLIVDFATLTGAARVALGTELPALFCNDEGLASRLLAAGERLGDAVWRLPLWRPYRRLIDSKVADINNAGEGGFAGAVTAALFLERFVPEGTAWAHLDLMAWNVSAQPGRPVGGEAMGLLAAYAILQEMAQGEAPPARGDRKARGGRKRAK